MKGPISASPILLAVSDLFFLTKIRTSLESQGLEVIVATREEEVLAKAEAKRPALIILDLGLSSLNPVGLVNRLRQFPSLRDLPVLGFTHHAQIDTWEKDLQGIKVKVVPNSFISSNIKDIVGIIDNII